MPLQTWPLVWGIFCCFSLEMLSGSVRLNVKSQYKGLGLYRDVQLDQSPFSDWAAQRYLPTAPDASVCELDYGLWVTVV